MDSSEEIVLLRCKEITGMQKEHAVQGAQRREQLCLPGDDGVAGGQRSD